MTISACRYTGTKIFLAAFFLATIVILPRQPAARAEAPSADWLNVRECGASGSRFETKATSTAKSNKVTVADPGDFKPGQEVMVSRCNIHFTGQKLWGPREQYGKSKPLGDTVRIRGYDGSLGSWTVYILDVDGANPPTFRWSDDLTRTWKQTKVPISDKWIPLSGGTEVRFGKLDWAAGYTVTFGARDQLISTIEKIEGKVVTLKDAANRAADDALMRHSDTAPLQAAVDRAIREKRNLYFPPGWYRLSKGLDARKPEGLTIQGVDGVNTVLDISEGVGACFQLIDGSEATLRNFRMVGHSGYAERDQVGHLRTTGCQGLWGFYLRHCNAVGIRSTERVLVENCHATKMSAECFYSASRARIGGRPEPKQYTKQITYLRCSVVDSGRNAFNNNDYAENTCVLYCRIVDVGGCTWEGASRFVKFVGNYVRNSGTVAMGNIGSRAEHLDILGSGQHIVADNVFESGVCYGGCAIRAACGATQVIVSNNLFVNFNSSAVEFSSTTTKHLPTTNTTAIGNIFDMTCVDKDPKTRHAILASVADTIVADNQIYVRGTPDPTVTGIVVREPALGVTVHDNLIRNCGEGIACRRVQARVGEVLDKQTFKRSAMPTLPLVRRGSHCYKGWNLVWIKGGKPAVRSVIEQFDPETCEFKLTKPAEMKFDQLFEVYPPDSANWNIHDNTITACLKPLVLDAYGSKTSRVANNLITRGAASGVEGAIAVGGRFKLIGNQITGFNEPGSAALLLGPDRFGQICPALIHANIIEDCTKAVKETPAGAWKASNTGGNVFIRCGEAPKQP